MLNRSVLHQTTIQSNIKGKEINIAMEGVLSIFFIRDSTDDIR